MGDKKESVPPSDLPLPFIRTREPRCSVLSRGEAHSLQGFPRRRGGGTACLRAYPCHAANELAAISCYLPIRTPQPLPVTPQHALCPPLYLLTLLLFVLVAALLILLILFLVLPLLPSFIFLLRLALFTFSSFVSLSCYSFPCYLY